MSDSAKTCMSCGSGISEDTIFCGSCGEPTGKVAEPSIAHPEQIGAPDALEASAAPGMNRTAIWSLVSGILGLFLFGLALGALAIFMSRKAKKEIAESGERGEGLATAGLVLGILGIIGYIVIRVNV